MKNFTKHFTIENIALIVLFAFAIWCAVSAVLSLQKNYELATRVREGETENKVLTLEIANAKLRGSYYKTDEFMELQAKSKLNKALPGEHLVILPNSEKDNVSADDDVVAPTDTTTDAVSDASTSASNLTNPQKWAQFLLGVKYD
jgi:cell division protein FtsB